MSKPVAIITGAGRGIGRAVAVELAKRQYQLALVARSENELQETAKLCGGGKALAGDVADANQVARIVEQAHQYFGRIDAFVHCAGFAPLRKIEDLKLEEWRQIIDVNLSAVVYFLRLLWPIWRKQGGGVAVNVSSYAGRDPFEGLGAYGAAKAGVNLLDLALAREGAEHHIRIHTVAPAATETAMFHQLFTQEQFPTEKTLDPSDVARVIAQCVCGDLVCTSGEVIYVHK
jgi:NAD(P)-dependent dehydrogenase (short-subunit alcohol dehydrogenase family)